MYDVIIVLLALLMGLRKNIDYIWISISLLSVTFFVGTVYHLKNLKLQRKIHHTGGQPASFWLLVLILGIGLYRFSGDIFTEKDILVQIANFFIFVYFAVAIIDHIGLKFRGDPKVLFKVIITPFFLFNVINFTMQVIGIKMKSAEIDEETASVMLGSLGGRIKLPLAGGINSYGILIGALMAVQLSFILTLNKRSFWKKTYLLTFLITIFLTDSRLALVASFISSGTLYWLSEHKRRKLIRYIPIIFIMAPAGFYIFFLFSKYIPGLDMLSRNTGDLSSGNGRIPMWESAIVYLQNFKSSDIFGLGVGGMRNLYKIIPTRHPHNSLLSIIIDYGYFGFIIFLYFLMKSAFQISNPKKTMNDLRVLYGTYLLYFSIVCSTESFFGFYYKNSIYLNLFFFMIPFGKRANHIKKLGNQTREYIRNSSYLGPKTKLL
jgi:hypothetical protein